MADRASSEKAEFSRLVAFDPVASAGLFVGVSHFEDERLAMVPFAVDDAVDLAYLFTLELGLVLPEHTALLLAGEPRKPDSMQRLARLVERGSSRRNARTADIYRALGQLTRGTEEGGLFIFTMATHGVSDQGGHFLLATDSLRERTVRTGVAVAEVFDEVSRAGAERRIVLLDACRERLSNGTRGKGESAMTKSFAEAIAQARGSVVLSAATLGGYAYDDEQRQNGVFTAAVLDGLHGEAPAGSEGWITVRTLADFVQQRVATWIRRNRPEDALTSLGIARHIEATSEALPLVESRRISPTSAEMAAPEKPSASDWRRSLLDFLDVHQKTFLVSGYPEAELTALRQRISGPRLSHNDATIIIDGFLARAVQKVQGRISYGEKAVKLSAAAAQIEYKASVEIMDFCWRECIPINFAIIDFYTAAAQSTERWIKELFKRDIAVADVRNYRKLGDFILSKMTVLVGDWRIETLRPLLKSVVAKVIPQVTRSAALFYEAIRAEVVNAGLPEFAPNETSGEVLAPIIVGWTERRVTIPWLNLFGPMYLEVTLRISAISSPRERLSHVLAKEILANGEREDSSLYVHLAKFLRKNYLSLPPNHPGSDDPKDWEDFLSTNRNCLRRLEGANSSRKKPTS